MIAPRPRGWDLWRAFSWPQWRLHPWRHAVAVLAIMLGVGLALAEFSAAVRGVNGEPDARLRGPLDRLDARWLDRALAHPQVRAAMPVIEAQGVAVTPDGHRVPVRLLGAAAGLALGLAVSAVLVHVVNPQSFHWTMELAVPVGRLAALALAVVAAGTVTAWASGRLAVRREAVLAVREEA